MLDRKSEPRKRTKSDGTSERTPPLSKAKSIRSFLNVNPETQFEIVRGLASPVRVRILRLLRRRGPLARCAVRVLDVTTHAERAA